jgi:hypothetical protein
MPILKIRRPSGEHGATTERPLETYFDVVDTYVFGETCLDIKCWGIQRIA